MLGDQDQILPQPDFGGLLHESNEKSSIDHI